jgi:hypothetical protein
MRCDESFALASNGLAARRFDHLRDPLAREPQRLEPLEHDDARPR